MGSRVQIDVSVTKQPNQAVGLDIQESQISYMSESLKYLHSSQKTQKNEVAERNSNRVPKISWLFVRFRSTKVTKKMHKKYTK